MPIRHEADFSSPEGALAALEDAYRRNDLDGAVAAKDFIFEAREMLLSLENLPPPEESVVKQTAEVLELAFRQQIKSSGFPDFRWWRCRVISKTQLRPNLVELIEECVSLQGQRSEDILHAALTEVGWRIVILPPSRPRPN